eukprot:11923451-Alexandrium_andersonii.AAC.1
MGCGAGADNPLYEVVLRLREVQGLLTGPDDMRGGTVRDLLKTMQVLREHIAAGGSLGRGGLPAAWRPGLAWSPAEARWVTRPGGPPRRRLV